MDLITNAAQAISFEPHTAYLDDIVAIEKAAHSHPWADSMLRQNEGKFDCYRVLVVAGNAVGYFYARCVAGEASLLNLAVAPSQQGKGYGKQLLVHFLTAMRARGGEEAWLEVRASNKAAISLYENLGFNQTDIRYDYYPSPSGGREDALVMSYWFD